MRIETFTLRISIDCHACRTSLPVNGFTTSVRCYRCNEVNALDLDGFWRSQLEPEYFAEALEMEQGDGREVTSMGGTSARVAYGRRTPRCQACKGPDLDPVPLSHFLSAGRAFCPACGTPIRLRLADDMIRAINPAARMVVGEDLEDDTTRAAHQKTQPVLFACMGCGGGLQVDGSSRSVVCQYCNAPNFLPDGLWQQLHPVPKPTAFFLVCEYDEATLTQTRWTSEEVRAADAARPDLSPAQYAQLARDEEDDVRIAVAGNPAAGPEALWQLAHDDDYQVRAAVAKNPAAPPQALAKLATDDDSDVLEALTTNPNLPPPVVEQMSRADSYQVRVAAAKHPALSVDSLQRLSGDDDSDVQEAARARIEQLRAQGIDVRPKGGGFFKKLFDD